MKNFVTGWLLLASLWAYAQPPTFEGERYVNAFTGDFQYSIPLMVVSGPNGESFPINASYSSGIRMEQQASWIGLGWTLNTGSISRSVKGIPDDWNAKAIENKKYVWPEGVLPASWEDIYPEDRNVGPVHFNKVSLPAHENIDYYSIFDTYQTTYGQRDVGIPFKFPDYDSYMAEGPGFSGRLNMGLFEFGSLIEPMYKSEVIKYYPVEVFSQCLNPPCYEDNAIYNEQDGFSRQPEFWYQDDHFVYGTVKPYNFNSASLFWQGFGEPSSTIADYRFGVFSSDNPTFTNNGDHVKGGYHIKYFLNSEINTFDPDPLSGPSGIGTENWPFLDFREVESGPRRLTTEFDPDGIGAIRVVAPNGMTYHYSLPVYTTQQRTISFELDAPDIDPLYIDEIADLADKKLSTVQWDEAYAYEWKLTAITGPDFEDVNKNGIADEGDIGYWIALNYTHWTESADYENRSPFYGYEINFTSELEVEESAFLELEEEKYYPVGSVHHNQHQLYYLDRVETATQVAYFVKEVRNDERSANGFGKLGLERIVLLDREDVSTFGNSQSIALNGATNPGSTATKTCNYAQYAANKSAIDAKSLKTVVFDQDYSLAPNVYNNSNSNYSTTSLSLSAPSSFELFDLITGKTNQSNSGKLTLNKVRIYEAEYTQMAPSFEFTYSDNNPDYNHYKKDMFGYFKHDNSDYNQANIQRGIYTTDANALLLDAWSLEKIKTPLGKVIQLEYEADVYGSVMAEQKARKVNPKRYFRITKLDGGEVDNPTFMVEDDDIEEIRNDAIDEQSLVKTRASFDYSCTVSYPFTSGSIDDAILGPKESIDYIAHKKYEFDITTPNSCASFNLNNDRTPYIALELDWVYGGGTRVKQIEIYDESADPSTSNSSAPAEHYSLTFSYEGGAVGHEPNIYYLKELDLAPDELRQSNMGANRHVGPSMVGYEKVEIHYQDLDDNSLGRKRLTFENHALRFTAFDDATIVNNEHYYGLIMNEQSDAFYGKLKQVEVFDPQAEGSLLYSERLYYDVAQDHGRVQESFYNSFVATEAAVSMYRTISSRIMLSPALVKRTVFSNGEYTITEFTDMQINGQHGKTVQTSNAKITESTISLHDHTLLQSMHDLPESKNIVNLTESSLLKVNGYTVGSSLSSLAQSIDQRAVVNGDWTTSTITMDYPRLVKQSITEGNETREVSETILINHNYRPLETVNFFGIHSAVKYDESGRNIPTASIVNANYESFTYSGFEHFNSYNVSGGGSNTYADGEIQIFTASIVSEETNGSTTVVPHTGAKMLKAVSGNPAAVFYAKQHSSSSSGSVVQLGLEPGRRYKASVWIHESSASNASLQVLLNGSTGSTTGDIVNLSTDANSAILEAGAWKLVAIEFDVPSDYVSSGGSSNDLQVILKNQSTEAAYFDDLQFYPIDAALSSTVYDSRLHRINATLAPSSFYVRYEYDEAGRIVKTYQEINDPNDGEIILESHEYGFKRPIN